MEDVLPAEVPHPRLHRPIRASQFQLADVDAVRLSLVRVKGLALEPLDEGSLPGSAASNYDQLHLSQGPPLRPARCKVIVEDFARGLWGSFLRTKNLLPRRSEHFIRQAQTRIAVEKQLFQPL